MKYPPRTIGLFQAAGLVVYVSLFATTIELIQRYFSTIPDPRPITNITLVLLTFIMSAMICGSIVFANPIKAYFDNRKEDAIKTVLWSLGWLFFFFVIFLILLAIFIFRA